MSFKKCPGSMAFSQPKIELVRCPSCGDTAEVWTDEADGKCIKCGATVCRTTTQSCIDWCKYAQECLGDEEHKRYQEMKTRLRKQALLKASEEHLPDERQRGQARSRVTHAENLLSREPSADPNVVIAAAALLDVRRPEPAAGDTQAGVESNPETGQPSAAAGILHELGYPEGFIKEVCGILRQLHKPGDCDGINFRIVRDADILSRDVASV
ncbi:MAG: hypothetical protein WCL16_08370 [bacterium]